MTSRLLGRAALLGAAAAAVHVALLLTAFNSTSGRSTFLEAWSDKHAHVLQPGDHRIIFVGGSNVAFGVDSSIFERQTHRRTINLGLQGAIGLSHMLQEATDVARAGDLVVVMPEYDEFFGDLMDGGLVVIYLLQSNRSALKYVSTWPQWRALSKHALLANRMATMRRVDQLKLFVRGTPAVDPGPIVYGREGFDVHGDLLTHLSMPPDVARVRAACLPIEGDLNPRAFTALSRSAEIVSKRGGQLVVIYPPFARTCWNINRSHVETVAASMPDHLARTTPFEWVYSDDAFLDTQYHLAGEGRQRHSIKLLAALAEWVGPLHPD